MEKKAPKRIPSAEKPRLSSRNITELRVIHKQYWKPRPKSSTSAWQPRKEDGVLNLLQFSPESPPSNLAKTRPIRNPLKAEITNGNPPSHENKKKS